MRKIKVEAAPALRLGRAPALFQDSPKANKAPLPIQPLANGQCFQGPLAFSPEFSAAHLMLESWGRRTKPDPPERPASRAHQGRERSRLQTKPAPRPEPVESKTTNVTPLSRIETPWTHRAASRFR